MKDLTHETRGRDSKRRYFIKCGDWYYPWTKEQAIQEYNQYEKDMKY